MRTKLLFSTLAFLLIPLYVIAGDEPVPRIRKADLGSQSFLAGSLKISIAKFKGNIAFTFGNPAEAGSGQVALKIENASKDFATFYPQRVSFVGRDDNSVGILDARHNYDEYVPAGEVRIAPGARVSELYRLKTKVRLPARMFYDDKLLVVITD